MVSNAKYENVVAENLRLREQLDNSDQANVKLLATEMELIAERDKLKAEVADLKAILRKLNITLHNLDKERLKIVAKLKEVSEQRDSLRRFISRGEFAEDKLGTICQSCKYMDKEGGVTCCCPEECFYSEAEEE